MGSVIKIQTIFNTFVLGCLNFLVVVYLENDTRQSNHNRSEVESEHYEAIGIKCRLENISGMEISASY